MQAQRVIYAIIAINSQYKERIDITAALYISKISKTYEKQHY